MNPNKLVEMTIELTRACPNKCIFCSSMSSSNTHEYLALTKIKKLLAAAAKLGLKRLYLSGGEPFAYPYLQDVVKAAEGIEIEKMVIYTAGSNIGDDGRVRPLDLTDIKQAISAKIQTGITVSLNSHLSAIHDSLTGMEGSWNNAVSCLKNALDIPNVDIDVHLVLTRQNFSHIEQLRKFLTKFGGTKKQIRLRLLRLVPQGRAISIYDEYALKPGDWGAVNSQIASISPNLCSVLLGAHLGHNLSHDYICGIDQPKLLIEPDGYVSVCPALKGTKRYMDVPNIKRMALETIIKSKWRKKIAASKNSALCFAHVAYEKPLQFMERSDGICITDEALLICLSENLDKLGYKTDIKLALQEDIDKIKKRLSELHGQNRADFLFQYFAVTPNGEKDPKICNIRQQALQGAIHVLKFNDLRENPARHTDDVSNKQEAIDLPRISELEDYIQAASEFENVLYGVDAWYRDHEVHALRVWLLGLFVLWRSQGNKIMPPSTTGFLDLDEKLYTSEELLAIFTIAALTHDIGYPLEKLSRLNAKLQNVLESFGGLDWRGVYSVYTLARHDAATNLIRHLRSKPVFKKPEGENLNKAEIQRRISQRINSYKSMKTIEEHRDDNKIDGISAVLRSQTKYYDKYLDSLEKNEHGLLSALLLQRKLTYFKESEFAFEEDYYFSLEEARQFLLRREILRAIATHTCTEIYLNNLLGLESLLFFCDEMQEWGRPYFKDLYEMSDGWRNKSLWLRQYTNDLLSWEISLGELSLRSATHRILNFGQGLSNRLRTGPDTETRKFKIEVRNSWSHNRTIFFYDFTADFSLIPRKISSSINSVDKPEFHLDMKKYIDKINKGKDYEKVVCDEVNAELENWIKKRNNFLKTGCNS